MFVPVRAARAAEQVSVVNTETLKHLGELGSSQGFVEKLVRMFLSDNAVLLGQIEEALAARNFHGFRSLVHAAKGSSASMGTDRLTRLCDSLGRLSDGELRVQAPALLRSISEEFAAARAQLEIYLREKQTSVS